MIAAILTLAALAAGGTWSDAAREYAAGPVEPQMDLRGMLTRHVVRESCAALDATAERRRAAFAEGSWQAWRDGVRKAVRDAMGPLPFGAEGGPLNVRAVSRHEREHFTVENVLFESLPGMDVNASVYLPRAEAFPPPWPAVVIPSGHSDKTQADYQRPAQIFARHGYVAVIFDAPAFGEKGPGNDHFSDGVRCYLTGQSSNRYFVIDALRCVDYLATRKDIDASRGVAMTGVSGGGITTLFSTLIDERIRAAGAACCAVPNALHPVLDGYAPCPETLAIGRFGAYDDPDLLAAALPTPMLLMAGASDEVFTADMSKRIAAEVAESFKAAGAADRFAFFLDIGGHSYSAAMALEFVKWMDRWLVGKERPVQALGDADMDILPGEMLACSPRTDANMFTANRDAAAALRERRAGKDARAAVADLLGGETPAPPEVREAAPERVWFHFVQEVSLQPEPGIELPATLLYPSKDGWRGGAVLYFDDRGRWTDLRRQGPLTQLTHFVERDTDGPAIMSVDLRGWGDTRPADRRYDLAGWGHRERWLAYVSAALGRPVMAERVRDALAALAYLRARPEIDPEKIVVGGRGLGGLVALHVAALDPRVAGVFSWDGLGSFESLAQSPAYAWSPEAFLPDVLQHYDLPELAAALPMPALVANPLDAEKKPLSAEQAQGLYAPGPRLRVQAGADTAAVAAFVVEGLQGR